MTFRRSLPRLLTLALAACGADQPSPAARPESEVQPEQAAAAEPVPAEPVPVASQASTASAPPAPTASEPAAEEAAPGYPVERVVTVLRRAKERFAVCAELDGTSTVAALRFEIDEQGKVTEANYWRGDGPIKPDARQACSLVVLRSLVFPPPSKKLTITYPLVHEAL